jgi:hypothetical protein
MPAINCLSCGCLTNSTLSNYWKSPGKGATECYARKVSGKWERGCSYDKVDENKRRFADSIIAIGKEDPIQ